MSSPAAPPPLPPRLCARASAGLSARASAEPQIAADQRSRGWPPKMHGSDSVQMALAGCMDSTTPTCPSPEFATTVAALLNEPLALSKLFRKEPRRCATTSVGLSGDGVAVSFFASQRPEERRTCVGFLPVYFVPDHRRRIFTRRIIVCKNAMCCKQNQVHTCSCRLTHRCAFEKRIRGGWCATGGPLGGSFFALPAPECRTIAYSRETSPPPVRHIIAPQSCRTIIWLDYEYVTLVRTPEVRACIGSRGLSQARSRRDNL
jgi:hypothetical protein